MKASHKTASLLAARGGDKKALLLLITVALTACGGSSKPGVGPIPTEPPATFGAASVTAGPAATLAQLPYAAGVSGQVLLPPGSGTATVILSVDPPGFTSALPTNGSVFPLIYITIRAESAFSLASMPGFNLLLPAHDATGVYYESQYVNGAWTGTHATGWGGIGSAAQPVACISSTTPAVSLQPGESLYLGVWTDAVLPTPMPLNNMPCPQTI